MPRSASCSRPPAAAPSSLRNWSSRPRVAVEFVWGTLWGAINEQLACWLLMGQAATRIFGPACSAGRRIFADRIDIAGSEA